jgi:hypothetical protein
LTQQPKTHDLFNKKSKTLSEAAKPEKFTTETKWINWIPTFLNCLCHIPGRDVVSLKYICWPNHLLDLTPCPDFIDEYINMAPLNGEAFAIDATEVHTLLVNFVPGNETAESKIKQHEDQINGRLDYIALQDYKGQQYNVGEIHNKENPSCW